MVDRLKKLCFYEHFQIPEVLEKSFVKNVECSIYSFDRKIPLCFKFFRFNYSFLPGKEVPEIFPNILEMKNFHFYF